MPKVGVALPANFTFLATMPHVWSITSSLWLGLLAFNLAVQKKRFLKQPSLPFRSWLIQSNNPSMVLDIVNSAAHFNTGGKKDREYIAAQFYEHMK